MYAATSQYRGSGSARILVIHPAGRSGVERLVQDVEADEDEGSRKDPVAVAADRLRDSLVPGEQGTRQAPDRDAHREYDQGDRDLGRPDRGEEGRVGGQVVSAVDDRERGNAEQAAGGGRRRLLTTSQRPDRGCQVDYAKAQRDEGEQPQPAVRDQREPTADRQRYANQGAVARILPGPDFPEPGAPARPR